VLRFVPVRNVLLIAFATLAVLWFASPWIAGAADALLNRVHTDAQAPPVPAESAGLHARLRVVDLHSDATLWARDLLVRNTRGLVDIPRLRDGNVALQLFSATTRHPLFSNYSRTPAHPDVVTLLAIAQRWPMRTWFSPFQRARFQAGRLHDATARSGGELRVVRTSQDLASLGALRPDYPVVGGVLLLEGMHATGRSLARIDSLFADGYRVFGIAHMFDNKVGGSAHGWHQGGLTPFGKRAVARVDSLGGIVDLAHASRAVIADVLALVSRPPLVSHTGLVSACAGPRNLDDADARAIAARGGLIAIGFWEAAVCGRDTATIARSLRRARDLVGIEHVAIGSDFDGAVTTPFDASGMVELTASLRHEGFSDEEVAAVMGENAWRFFSTWLPVR